MQNENAKPISISKQLIYEAFKSVKANRGSAGVDKVTIKDYENNLRSNLYKLWNRMSSGSYFPPPVKLVEIPKSNGGKRPLGIPTVSDRIAQMAVVKLITPGIEPYFHEDSYAYRPHRSAHDAVAKAQERCWKETFWIASGFRNFTASDYFQAVSCLMIRRNIFVLCVAIAPI